MLSKKILLGVFVILLNMGFATAETLHVGQEQAYPTIQAAVDAAQPNDVISVSEGTYYENVIIKKSDIWILGKNREKTIIDGRNKSSGFLIDQANNVKVSGFTVQNTGATGKEDGGITLYSADSNIIANMMITGNAVGISIYSGSDSNVVSGNDIRSNGRYGIFIFSSNDNKVYSNNIKSNKIGVYADSARTNSIYSNNLIDNGEQAYDNSGLNAWDDGKAGNYWSNFTGRGAYGIPGGANAKDNYPLSNAVIIRSMPVPTPESPGFTGAALVLSLVLMVVLKSRKKH